MGTLLQGAVLHLFLFFSVSPSSCSFERQSSRNSVIFKLCQQVGTLMKILRPLHWNARSWPLHMSAQQRRERHAAQRYISHQKCLEGLLCDGDASFMLGEMQCRYHSHLFPSPDTPAEPQTLYQNGSIRGPCSLNRCDWAFVVVVNPSPGKGNPKRMVSEKVPSRPGRGDLALPPALINSSWLSEVIESNAFRHINRAAGRKARKLGKKALRGPLLNQQPMSQPPC
ncbi:hypothetical protein QQF64_003723 [Cirrhinus molitorella]|uniref:Uncharacterized protein n=1 Tax=Cirrhinus molitorella TaxID=172907 RepID=A0ABR3MM46_9TELE